MTDINKIADKFVEKYGVYYKGELVHFINSKLVARQKLNDEQVEFLKCLHVSRLALFDLMREASDPAELHEMAKRHRELEFAMQKTWGFTEDAGMHMWYDVPQCTCPKMDNAERRGEGMEKYRIYAKTCRVHGDLEYA